MLNSHGCFMISPRIITIGVYGFGESEFFAQLQAAHVDCFCDVRQRRAVRGRDYAFVNSLRLQARLAEMGIRYLHIKELAPSPQLRQTQYAADKRAKTGKRDRSVLDPAFAAAYRAAHLTGFSPQAFVASLRDPSGRDAQVVALFCVERAPEACHRSLIAAELAAAGLEVQHIR
jgi:uncharacterized protein (DUF488 family)